MTLLKFIQPFERKRDVTASGKEFSHFFQCFIAFRVKSPSQLFRDYIHDDSMEGGPHQAKSVKNRL